MKCLYGTFDPTLLTQLISPRILKSHQGRFDFCLVKCGQFSQRCPGVWWSSSWCLGVGFSAEFQLHRAHRNEVFSLEEDLSQPLLRRGPELLEFHLFLDEWCFIQRQVRQCGKGWTGPWKNNMAAVIERAEHTEGLDYPPFTSQSCLETRSWVYPSMASNLPHSQSSCLTQMLGL